jgi:hypothetical protein
MDNDNIVENACARATLQFQKEFETENKRLIKEEDMLGVWANSEALKNTIPNLLKNALLLAFNEIYCSNNEG